MGKAVLLTAYLCQQYGINVDNVRDHSELHGMGLASNHGDITHWLKRYGLTMDDFRRSVKYALEDGVSVDYVDCDDVKGLYDAITVNPGAYLNLREGPGKNYKAIAKIPQGALVTVLDDSQAEWYKVSFQGETGFAMAQYLEPYDDPALTEPPEEQPTTQDDFKISKEALISLSEQALALYQSILKLLGGDNGGSD
jgi:uncharacterized protein YgiM (DUF1202 family)